MKDLGMAFAFVAILLLVSCESGGLGMKIKVTETAVPFKIPEPTAEAQAGNLKIAIIGMEAKAAQVLADALASAFKAEDVPDGVLTFTTLSVRNRSMQQPPRASAEIDATCIWHETDEKAVGFDITVRTFSIEIEDWGKEPKYLRDEALKGMVRELADTF